MRIHGVREGLRGRVRHSSVYAGTEGDSEGRGGECESASFGLGEENSRAFKIRRRSCRASGGGPRRAAHTAGQIRLGIDRFHHSILDVKIPELWWYGLTGLGP